MKKTTHSLKTGLFGIGLETYWGQFEGLKDRLIGYLSEVNDNLAKSYVRVINPGLIDTPEKAYEADHNQKNNNVINNGINVVFFCFIVRYKIVFSGNLV